MDGRLIVQTHARENASLLWNPNSQDMIYSPPTETLPWLQANQEEFGYVKNQRYTLFGEYALESGKYMFWNIWQNLIPPKEGPFAGLTTTQDYEYVGVDGKGLIYYQKYHKPIISPGKNPNYTAAIDVIIVDTWTRRVIGRTIPAGQWQPAYTEEWRVLGKFPSFIHPDGSYYIFDASLQPREYHLKRLANDWWQELGVDQRRIGRMKQNKVPLYEQNQTASTFSSYNYENEYVWVLEEKKVGTALWFKIRKMDGREGWIPSDVVHFEELD